MKGARRRAPAARADTPSTAGEPARALLVGVVALTAVRIVSAWLPGMWAWGLNLLRFSSPALWLLALTPLVVAHPRVAAVLGRVVAGLGERIARSPVLAACGAFVLACALTLSLPDRSQFVGDFLLRAGRLLERRWLPEQFPQAMPLDVFLHFTLPVRIAHALSLPDPLGTERWASAIKAGALAAAGVALAAGLRLRGAAAVVTAAVAAFAVPLAICCGYSKAFVELAVLTGVFIACGVSALRGGRGLPGATLAFALALGLHRAALLLLPSWIWLVATTARGDWSARGRRRPVFVASLLVGVAALAWAIPRVVAIVRSVDRPQLLAAGGSWAHVLATTLAPLRLLDVANVLLLLCPLLPLVAVAAFVAERGAWATRPLRWLGATALIHLAAIVLVRPQQGFFRDWDVAAAGAVALTFFTAATLGVTLVAARRAPAVSAAIVLAAIASLATFMALDASLERSLARVQAYVVEPPPKPAEPLGLAWRWLGLVYHDSDRPEAATRAFQRAAELVPSESNMIQWSAQETERGDDEAAQRVDRLMTERFDSYAAWLLLARSSSALGDRAEAARAARRALALDPGQPEPARLLEEALRPAASPESPASPPSRAPRARRLRGQ